MALLSLMIPALATADITTGLVGHWPLDGDAQDASGNGHHGTVNGAVTFVAARDGSPASAARFTGTTSAHINLGQPPALLIKGAMTVSAWVRADTMAQTGRIIAKQGPASGRSWGLNLETDRFARFDVGTTPTARVRADSEALSFAATEWFHLAGVFRPGEAVEIYVNGALAKQMPTTVTVQWIENNLPINIGRRPEPGTPWRGDIDEVRMYARALSAADVKDVFAYVASPRVKAWEPQPANGAVGVSIPLLQWKAGVTALVHNVYVGTKPELGPAELAGASLPITTYYYAAPLLPGTTYYWRVDEVEADLKTIHTGDVWSFVTQAATAYAPKPADGDGNVSAAVTLTWQTGKNALKHHVYLGDSLDAVTQGAAAADKGEVELKVTSFTPTGLLDATTYYWRVDEVLVDGTVMAGPVWSFTTFLPIEDFESYTDEEGGRIYETWIDGWTNGTASTVGYIQAPFAERGIVHGGKQSMPFDYNNPKAPFYSEAQREFASTPDWTSNGLNTLVLYVQGKSGNGAAPLYVAVEDSSKRVAVVTHPDTAVVKATTWVEWQIPFSSLTASGVNLARVKKVYIGVGDRKNPVAGGKGLLYVDDLRAIKGNVGP
ncbi:MAG: hypothetical protein MUC88_18420 [Planctomycetes bacterium]|nr:hypothetical protein [Planctomycetota bacterium]